ncbi:hypothetical protein GQ42DRAFT_159646, partial [Ramicandelaber brevisporus]
IFLDGSFVAKSKLRNVSPGEEFECSLGVDESIRIDFPAAQKKITASRGLVFATQGVVNISQKITVRNTKQVPVRILVSEQIPSARDDRIKVQLLEPNPRNVTELSAADRAKALIPPVTAVDSPYWINPDKKTRLLWSLELKPSQRVTLPVSFEVTHPTSESVADERKSFKLKRPPACDDEGEDAALADCLDAARIFCKLPPPRPFGFGFFCLTSAGSTRGDDDAAGVTGADAA